MVRYRAEPCPCGDHTCKKWLVIPGADMQGCGFDEETAKAVAQFLNVRQEPNGLGEDRAIKVVPGDNITGMSTKVLLPHGAELGNVMEARVTYNVNEVVHVVLKVANARVVDNGIRYAKDEK